MWEWYGFREKSDHFPIIQDDCVIFLWRRTIEMWSDLLCEESISSTMTAAASFSMQSSINDLLFLNVILVEVTQMYIREITKGQEREISIARCYTSYSYLKGHRICCLLQKRGDFLEKEEERNLEWKGRKHLPLKFFLSFSSQFRPSKFLEDQK